MSLAFGASTVFILLVLLIFLLLFFAAWLPLERGRPLFLRPLRMLGRVREMAEQASENGTTVHFSPGPGGLNGQSGTAETLNGITALSTVSRLHARSHSRLVTTTNDTGAYLLAEDVARHAYQEAGQENDFHPENNRFISQQDRMAYTAGLNYALANEQVSGAVLIGSFGSEYLLAGETLANREMPQVVGSSQFEALPLMLGTAGPENTLLGEEIYAVPAYLDREPAKLASLQVQDWLRAAIIMAIVLGALAATLGFNIGDFFLR